MTAPEPRDEDSLWLAQRAAQGDRGAADALLERYLPDLRAYVRLRMGEAMRERESTSDLVQSTCREILNRLDRFRFPDETAFRRWLMITAQRKIADRADHYGALKRTHEQEGGEDDERLLASYGRFSSPSHHATVVDEIARVERAFDRLTDEQREIITLAHIVGLSRREIAEQLGKSESTVRVVLHRAIARVVEVIQGDDG